MVCDRGGLTFSCLFDDNPARAQVWLSILLKEEGKEPIHMFGELVDPCLGCAVAGDSVWGI